MILFKRNYILSIIIPCFNSSKTIKRTIDSILKQDINKNLYEVIICNDSNEDNYLDIVNKYKKKMNIKIVNTKSIIKCPANTRQVGIKHAKGKYITFIDHDDEFTDSSLNKVIEYIKNYTGNNPVISTNIIKVVNNKNISIDPYHAFSFLHGKFYNLEFIKKYKISFRENMKAYEDIYFNNLIMNKLYKKDIYTFEELDITTYKWIYNKSSISNDNSKRGYLFDNFNDFIIAASNPFINEYSIVNERQVIATLIRTFYYYQAAISNKNKKDYEDIYDDICALIHDIKLSYKIDNKYIINYIKENKEIENDIKKDCVNQLGDFKETESLEKFIKKTKEV